MRHFYQDIEGSCFNFKRAYDRILDRLPTDRHVTLVELGSCLGGSAAYLGVELVNRGHPFTFYCVDTFDWMPGWVHPPDRYERPRLIFERNMQPLAGKYALLPMKSLDAARQFEDRSCDMVWIDTDHSYATTKAEIAAWWPKVKWNGVMGGDDYGYSDGVQRAVQESGPFEVGDDTGWLDKTPWQWWWRTKNGTAV